MKLCMRFEAIFVGQFVYDIIPFPQRRFPENFILQSRVTQFVNPISFNVHYNENNSYDRGHRISAFHQDMLRKISYQRNAHVI